MSWGTDVMMLGKADPSLGAPQSEESPALRPVNWVYVLGSYAGAWAGGGTVGYVVSRQPQGIVKGGLAASALWGIGEAVAHARDRDLWLTGLFIVMGTGSLWAAWKRP